MLHRHLVLMISLRADESRSKPNKMLHPFHTKLAAHLSGHMTCDWSPDCPTVHPHLPIYSLQRRCDHDVHPKTLLRRCGDPAAHQHSRSDWKRPLCTMKRWEETRLEKRKCPPSLPPSYCLRCFRNNSSLVPPLGFSDDDLMMSSSLS